VYEADLVKHVLPQASEQLAPRLKTIIAFESFCQLIEDSFEWLLFLSSRAGASAISSSEFADVAVIREMATEVAEKLAAAQELFIPAPRQAQLELQELARFFEAVQEPRALFQALLARHANIQKNKPPEGKREWFEHASDGRIFVRPLYRVEVAPQPATGYWPRPYRLTTVYSFCRDLGVKA
jgi:hypothetical protein